MIQSSPIWRCKDDILQSVPGIGPVTSASLICDLPELGVLSPKKIAMLAGLAPLNCDSGKYKGRRRIWGGRACVRSGLYMATMAAIRCNPAIKGFYQRLIAAGKCHKVAATACMRKLLIIVKCDASRPNALAAKLILDSKHGCSNYIKGFWGHKNVVIF